MSPRPLGLALALSLALVPVARGYAPDKEADEAVKGLKKALASKDDKTRAAAIEGVAAVQHRWVAEALASPLEKDAAPAVRVAAAKALGAQWSPRGVEVLAKSLSGDEEVPHEAVLATIEALGASGSDAAVATLVDFLVPSPHFYRNNKAGPSEATTASARAILALRHTGSSRAAGPLVDFMGDEAPAHGRGTGRDGLQTAAEAALAELTGQKLKGAKAWRDWWSANGESAHTVKVYRCCESGKLWDKAGADSKCPACPPEKAGKCSILLRTRFADAAAPGSEEPKKK